MTENQYVRIGNLTSLRNALNCLQFVMGGDEYGLSKAQDKLIRGALVGAIAACEKAVGELEELP